MHETTPNNIRPWYYGAQALNLFDKFLTYIALSTTGYLEFNPLVRKTVNIYGLFGGIILMASIGYLVIHQTYKEDHPRAIMVIFVIYSAVVLSNLFLLLGIL